MSFTIANKEPLLPHSAITLGLFVIQDGIEMHNDRSGCCIPVTIIAEIEFAVGLLVSLAELVVRAVFYPSGTFRRQFLLR